MKNKGNILTSFLILVFLVATWMVLNISRSRFCCVNPNAENFKASLVNLKKYENEKYGFSFSYPSNFSVVDNVDLNIVDPENLGLKIVNENNSIIMYIETGSLLFNVVNADEYNTLNDIQKYLLDIEMKNNNVRSYRVSDKILIINGHYRLDPNSRVILIEPKQGTIIRFETDLESIHPLVYDTILENIQF